MYVYIYIYIHICQDRSVRTLGTSPAVRGWYESFRLKTYIVYVWN